MKKLFVLLALLGTTAMATEKTIYDFTLNAIDGQPTPLSGFKGKIVLLVNVASRCGYTPQYAALESIYEKYKGRGFLIFLRDSLDRMIKLHSVLNDLKSEYPEIQLGVPDLLVENFNLPPVRSVSERMLSDVPEESVEGSIILDKNAQKHVFDIQIVEDHG